MVSPNKRPRSHSHVRSKRLIISAKRTYWTARVRTVQICRPTKNSPQVPNVDYLWISKRFHFGSHVCPLCLRKFKTKVSLATHIRSKHYQTSSLTRRIARMIPQLLKAVNVRELMHSANKISSSIRLYKCLQCSKIFDSYLKVTLHKRSHLTKSSFICPLCSEELQTKYLLRKHMKVHSRQRRLICTVCKKYFRTEAHLKVHSLVHSNVRPFKCYLCLRTFKYIENLGKHMAVHTREHLFMCKVCKAYFKRKDRFNVHSLMHSSDLPMTCPLCSEA